MPREELSRDLDVPSIGSRGGTTKGGVGPTARPPGDRGEVRRDLEQIQRPDAYQFRRVAALPRRPHRFWRSLFRPCIAAGDLHFRLLLSRSEAPRGAGVCPIEKKFEGDEFDVAVSPDGRFVVVAAKFPGFNVDHTRTRRVAATRCQVGVTGLRASDDGVWVSGVHRDRMKAVR